MGIFDGIGHLPLVDIGIFLALFAAFILGVFQGAIRRVLGIISILFAFLVAANLRDPVGDYLASNWTQFAVGYNRLLAFLVIFCAVAVAASIVIQGFYKRTEIYAAHPIVDDAIGGVLGLVEGVILLVIAVVIINSFSVPPPYPGDLPQMRQAQDIMHQSGICNGVKDTLAPGFIHLLGFLLPSDLMNLYP